MTKAGARGGSLSTPHIATPAAESDRYQGMPNDLTVAVMAMASHDLRQPLQVIIGAHHVLARRLSGGEERTLLTLIEGAAMRLASTLDGLVETLRLADAPAREQHGPVSLHPILAGLALELTAAAELKGIELRVMPASAAISSHPVLLSGILRNLIRNAIEYTPRGGRVLVGCRRRGSEAHIEVHDTGAGFAIHELPRIFSAFHRADKTRTDGLGLGLFIVKRAAQYLGHRVEVRSGVNQGSCFVVVAKVAPGSRRDMTSAV
jgi:two-component system, OmpR family, phosphate regulon sensor histidine kinase PhoR